MEHYICESLEGVADSSGAIFVEESNAKTLRIENIEDVELGPFVNFIKQYAYQKDLNKISLKVSEAQALQCFQYGFKVEGSVLAYYGLQDALYVVYFLNGNQPILSNTEHDIIEEVLSNDNSISSINKSINKIEVTAKPFIEKKVKKDNFVNLTGKRNLPYKSHLFIASFAVVSNKVPVATASARYHHKQNAVELLNIEVDESNLNAQYLDDLIDRIEQEFIALGCLSSHVVVSSKHLEINTLFAKCHYEFGGTLTEESFIDGKLVGLNIWFKQLVKQ